MKKIDINNKSGTYICNLHEQNGAISHRLGLPAYSKALYVAARQKYDPFFRSNVRWYDGVNRFNPLVFDNLTDIEEGGFFLILKTADEYLALLPLTGEKTLSWFSPDNGSLIVRTGVPDNRNITGSVPVIAWSYGNSVYEACYNVWDIALASPLINYSTVMRKDKHYPEVFKYLGWCSWEQFKTNISCDLLLLQLENIEEGSIPVRYILIDDGHLSACDNKLKSFIPDGDKFIGGLTPITEKKCTGRIDWMGIWLCFEGYWDGICTDNALGSLNACLREVKPGTLMPKGDFASAAVFYDAMLASKRRDGFDFVKVDGQSRNLRFYEGMDSPVEASANNSRALEAAASYNMNGLINCMAHNPVCIFNTRKSPITRCSEDYIMGDEKNARRHIYNSYCNILWLGQTVWGDHDMFHSSDPVSGRMMAISKAMSGGPVYLSDAPKDFDKDLIVPLCYNDGELLRPLAPAAPSQQSIFVNPYEDMMPFVAAAPLQGMAAAVACYNLTEPAVKVTGSITSDDYISAFGMLQPYGESDLPKEGLVIYNWLEGKACRLKAEYRFEITGFGDKLFILSPVINGWAIIGRPDKYLSAAAVKVLFSTTEEIVINMTESGPILIWLEEGEPYPENNSFKRLDNNLWKADIGIGARNHTVRIEKTHKKL